MSAEIDGNQEHSTPTYCVAVVEQTEVVNTPDGDIVETSKQTVEFSSFAEVLRHLKTDREAKLNYLAERIANGSAEEGAFHNVGGFAIVLHSRYGSVVEFGLGRDYALMIRLVPRPTEIYRNGPESSDDLVFYIDGWHYTELRLSELSSREDALEKLEHWIETDEFPSSAS